MDSPCPTDCAGCMPLVPQAGRDIKVLTIGKSARSAALSIRSSTEMRMRRDRLTRKPPSMVRTRACERKPALALFSWYTIYERVSHCQATCRSGFWRQAAALISQYLRPAAGGRHPVSSAGIPSIFKAETDVGSGRVSEGLRPGGAGLTGQRRDQHEIRDSIRFI
jgi:hypothetical protein